VVVEPTVVGGALEVLPTDGDGATDGGGGGADSHGRLEPWADISPMAPTATSAARAALRKRHGWFRHPARRRPSPRFDNLTPLTAGASPVPLAAVSARRAADQGARRA